MAIPNLSKKRVLTAILITAVLIAAIFNVYAISEAAGLIAIWNQNEAYFFSQVDRRGDSSSYLLFPWILFKEYVIGGFAAAVIPSDTREFLVVLHITPAGVERHVVKLADRADGGEGSEPSHYTPIDGRIYVSYPRFIGHFMQDGQMVANDPNDSLGWWAGDHFEKATQDERERLGGIGRLTRDDFDNNAEGWSRRVLGASPSFTMNVGNQFSLVVNNVSLGNPGNGYLSIDLQRPGKDTERIAVFERAEGGVSRAEYRHAFYDPE